MYNKIIIYDDYDLTQLLIKYLNLKVEAIKKED